MSVNCKINANRLIVYYRATCNWVGFLFPLITPIQSGVENLEMELSIFSFEVFQLEQFGEQEIASMSFGFFLIASALDYQSRLQ